MTNSAAGIPDGDQAQPIAVLVTGMHASGGSLLARLIALLNQTVPGTPDPAENERFPHLEHSSAVGALNRRILQDLGSNWSKPMLLFVKGKSVGDSTKLIRDMIRTRYLDLAVGIIRSGRIADAPMILEDPCLCLFYDLWDAALRQAGYSVRTVHVVRNPLEVANSLQVSRRLATSKALQIWVQYNIELLTAASRDRQDLTVVPYSALLQTDGGLSGLLRTRLGRSAAAPTDDATITTEWTRLFDGVEQEASIPGQVVARSPLVASIVKRLYAALAQWENHNAVDREAALAELAVSFEDQSLFAGNILQVELDQQQKPAAPAVSSSTGERRKVLIHYHLFKNAGTSVDSILRKNFGQKWINTEFPPRSQVDHQEAIRRLILDNRNLLAISSHTLMLPTPEIADTDIFPILFVRHPLDRLKSAYEFERKQESDTAGAVLAKQLDFAGYVRARLAIPGDRSCRNFQAFRLAMVMPGREGTEQERALAAIDRLPFVGLVEAFKSSVEVLQQRVRPIVPEFGAFDSWENYTDSRHKSLDERIATIRTGLGEECFSLLMAANEADMAVYEKVRAMYQVAAATNAA